MNFFENKDSSHISTKTSWREQLKRVQHISAFERLSDFIKSLRSGDRVLFYVLAGFLVMTSLMSLYALEQTLLEKVPTYGGKLVEGEIGNPQFINPLLAISDADRDLSTLTYAGLMGLSGSGELVPVLAESYEVGDDGKTYTFTLKKDAKFTDGTTITAADVVFTVRKAQDPGLKSPEYANWSGVNVAALDPQTVRFTLSKAYAPFVGLTTLGILPARLWQDISNTEFPFSSLQTNPVGSGPFKIANVSRNASGLIRSVTLVANPYYVLGRPYLNGIQFNFYSNAEDLAGALESGAIESAYGIPKNGAVTAPYARVFGVFFNPNDNPVYARAEVRKALSLAVDRSAIVESVLGGYATPLMGPVPPGAPIDQVPVPQGDTLGTAVKVLQSGGWTYDGGAREWVNAKAKQTLGSLTIRTSNVPELKNVASAVKADWEKLGIRVDIELYEPGDLSQNVIRPRKYGALLYGMVIGRDQDLYAFWDSQERNDPGLNIALYVNKTVDALLDETRSTANADTRVANLQKIENIVAADYPAAFLYAPNFIYALPEDLSGVELSQIITPADRFATVASWYRYTDAVWPFFAKQRR
jgi:peptide/nickel transport system substrate-binding protein